MQVEARTMHKWTSVTALLASALLGLSAACSPPAPPPPPPVIPSSTPLGAPPVAGAAPPVAGGASQAPPAPAPEGCCNRGPTKIRRRDAQDARAHLTRP